MPQSLTNGTQLKCNQGTTPSELKVTSQSFMQIEGKAQATEEDKQPNTNIKPFGQCRLKPSSGGYLPCMPVLTQWQDTSPFEIEGKKELLDSSTCPCSVGGTISVIKSAQNFVKE
uniref:DUF4280 domain-containing protein n=1 Tax=Ornithobacterium rhinotracheale TaxID=28251 RepID=UPI0039A48953